MVDADCFECDIESCPQYGHDVAPMPLCPNRSDEDLERNRASVLNYLLTGIKPIKIAANRVKFNIKAPNGKFALITMNIKTFRSLTRR